MREVKLPSGATLKIHPAPFRDARALYQAVAEEMKVMRLDPLADIDVNLFKDLFCTGISSKKIESAIEQCMKKALYNDLPINDEMWEPVERRDDYLTVCMEVAKENILPFLKSLYAKYGNAFQKIKTSLA